MKTMPTVALVGRPNVGKSCLFNRLVGRFISIVHDQPGVTRDVVTAEVDNHFVLMDTGGIGLATAQTPSDIMEATEEQVGLAIQAADLILLVVNGQEGCTPLDESVAEKLRRYGKKIVLVVNKLDSFKHQRLVDDFYGLGITPVLGVSAEHNQGIGGVFNAIEAIIGPPAAREPSDPASKRVKICFAGRPNVGKSSILNALLKSNRLIVSDMPGTTRDAITIAFDYTATSGQVYPFTLMDTAGVRTRSKVRTSLDFFSFLRTEKAIEGSEIVFLVLDAREGVTESDKKIAGKIIELGKGIIIVVNKWDYAQEALKAQTLEGFRDEKAFKKAFAQAINKELFFLPASPILFVSAQNGYALDTIFQTAWKVHEMLHTPLLTSKVNTVIADILERRPPVVVHSKRFKVYYALQVGQNPFTIKLFCNRKIEFQGNYQRYLTNNFNQAFELTGCPVTFELIGKPPRKPPE